MHPHAKVQHSRLSNHSGGSQVPLHRGGERREIRLGDRHRGSNVGQFAHDVSLVFGAEARGSHGYPACCVNARRSASRFSGRSDNHRMVDTPGDTKAQYLRNLARATGSVATARVSVMNIDS
jgi:hypothetical protein